MRVPDEPNLRMNVPWVVKTCTASLKSVTKTVPPTTFSPNDSGVGKARLKTPSGEKTWTRLLKRSVT